MSLPFPVGVLDPGAHDVRGTLEVAAAVDSSGYGRYWLTEHHDEGAPHGNPSMVAAMVAGVTSTMRVGPCGVLLRYYTPLAVANEATLLEALFPGRVDFGIASARAPSPHAEALGGGLPADDVAFEERLRVFVAILRRETELVPLPMGERAGGAAPPPVWISGNSDAKAQLAATLGAGLASSSFHTSVPMSPDTFARYRDAFAPRPELPAPVTALAVSVLCAETEAEARVFHDVYQRLFGYEQTLIGTPSQCVEELAALRHASGADELLIAPRQNTAAGAIRGLLALAEALGRSAVG
ncbi:MAG: LLM class flavin-dependent oxidoreductase [Pseudomonadota bacterium]|nr:LLM class flavin-dependent oxidoreductase [Pseudomonadota bacterium]